MKINTTDVNSPSGFYAVDFETFADTLNESKITYTLDMGSVTIHHGTREGSQIWLLDNPCGVLYGIWTEEDAAVAQH